MPTNGPCRTRTRLPGTSRASTVSGAVRVDQSPKLPEVEAKPGRIVYGQDPGDPVRRQARHPLIFRPVEEHVAAEDGHLPDELASAIDVPSPYQGQIERNLMAHQLASQGLFLAGFGVEYPPPAVGGLDGRVIQEGLRPEGRLRGKDRHGRSPQIPGCRPLIPGSSSHSGGPVSPGAVDGREQSPGIDCRPRRGVGSAWRGGQREQQLPDFPRSRTRLLPGWPGFLFPRSSGLLMLVSVLSRQKLERRWRDSVRSGLSFEYSRRPLPVKKWYYTNAGRYYLPSRHPSHESGRNLRFSLTPLLYDCRAGAGRNPQGDSQLPRKPPGPPISGVASARHPWDASETSAGETPSRDFRQLFLGSCRRGARFQRAHNPKARWKRAPRHTRAVRRSRGQRL